MINLNNNTDYAFSKRKSGVGYGKPTLATSKDLPKDKKDKKERIRKPKQKTKIVYVKEVAKPKKKKKKKK